MQQNLIRENVTKSMLRFAAHMILGNLLQQFYNVADTLIVGQFPGANAIASSESFFFCMVFTVDWGTSQ